MSSKTIFDKIEKKRIHFIKNNFREPKYLIVDYKTYSKLRANVDPWELSELTKKIKYKGLIIAVLPISTEEHIEVSG